MKGNLKWVFIGLLVFCLMFALISGFVIFLMKIMKGDAYDLSLQSIRENSVVIEQIGRSIEPSWYVLGNISTNGPEGSAAIEYSITGETSKADVYVYATKHAGEWVLNKLIVVPENDSKTITIIEDE